VQSVLRVLPAQTASGQSGVYCIAQCRGSHATNSGVRYSRFNRNHQGTKSGTVDAFRYQSGLETMDFKYPYPDWLERHVVVRGEFGLDLCTKFGKVTVRPGQWIVNAGKGNIHVLDPDVFHAEYAAVKDV
jgi:hypothetical protein